MQIFECPCQNLCHLPSRRSGVPVPHLTVSRLTDRRRCQTSELNVNDLMNEFFMSEESRAAVFGGGGTRIERLIMYDQTIQSVTRYA
jgi:hypothetical protein